MDNILFLATTNLHERNGGALATLAYYNAFLHLYNQRVKLALPAEYCYGAYKTAIPIPSQKRIFSYLEVFRGRFHRYKDFFQSYLKTNSSLYKIAVLNDGFCAGDMVKMFQSYGIKVLVIHHNYEPEYHMDNKTLPTFWGTTPFFIIRNEHKAYKNADLNAFLTKADITLHQQHYGKSRKPPYLLGVFEPKAIQTFPGELKNTTKKPLNIIITGSMNSEQTIQGIMDFKQNYFPIIRNVLPQWKIIIAGRNPDKRIQKFTAENSDCITLIPNPEDIDKVISMGSIFLCPTNVGGGLKLRLMDGLRNGTPILVHKISARGYDPFFTQPFFQTYNDNNSFIEGLTHLTQFIENNNDYSRTICELYRSNFSFESGCNRIKTMMQLL